MLRLTRAQVREIDRRAIEEYHIPGIVLMENAARAAASYVHFFVRQTKGGKVLIICGGGNNGGGGNSGGGGSTPSVNPPAVSGGAGAALAYAYAQLGKKYVFGTAGPNTFDCSGLTMMAWKAAGVTLPHNAAQQWGKVRHISRSQLMPGDLVFYNGLGHVGIYIGNNQIIHAPNSRTVVKVAPVDIDTLYGYGRVT